MTHKTGKDGRTKHFMYDFYVHDSFLRDIEHLLLWNSFADFLFANSQIRIHIGKFSEKAYFPVKNVLFICEFGISGPKWRNVSTTIFMET